MGHVYVRLSGYGMRLKPYWPYRFAHAEGSPAVIEVTRFENEQERLAVINGTDLSVSPSGSQGVVEVFAGPDEQDWRIETSLFSAGWPDDFTVESSQDETDNVAFYLIGSGEAVIFPQGPAATDQLPGPEGMAAPGQRIVDRRRTGEAEVVELAYTVDGEDWWQGHWLVPYGDRQTLVITAQAPEPESASARLAADHVVSTLRPADQHGS